MDLFEILLVYGKLFFHTFVLIVATIVVGIFLRKQLQKLKNKEEKEKVVNKQTQTKEDGYPLEKKVTSWGQDVVIKYVSDNQKINILLEQLSNVWKRNQIVVQLEDLSRLWRAENVDDILFNMQFNYPRIQEFFEKHIKGKAYFGGNNLSVLVEILRYLDERGDCPSVVRRDNELYDNNRPKDTFEILSQVTLRDHALDVADEMIKSTGGGVLSPKLFIAALGHDLGKIEGFEKSLYALGDHPRISILILEQIPGFNELSFYNEVKMAILNHHRGGDGYLLQKLKEADANARQKELKEYFKAQGMEEKIKVEEIRVVEEDIMSLSKPKIKKDRKPQDEQTQKEDKPLINDKIMPKEVETTQETQSIQEKLKVAQQDEDIKKVVEDTADLFGIQLLVAEKNKKRKQQQVNDGIFIEESGKVEDNLTTEDLEFKKQVKKRKPQRIDIEFLDLDKLLSVLGKAINQVYTNNCFNAVSTKEGYVFFLTDYIFMKVSELLTEQGAGELVERANEDQAIRQDILYTLIEMIDEKKQGIPRNLMKKPYFGGPFYIIFKDGTTSEEVFYTPMYAELFGDVSELEARKDEKIDLIKDIIPKYKMKNRQIQSVVDN
jgi:hypothetical protein